MWLSLAYNPSALWHFPSFFSPLALHPAGVFLPLCSQVRMTPSLRASQTIGMVLASESSWAFSQNSSASRSRVLHKPGAQSLSSQPFLQALRTCFATWAHIFCAGLFGFSPDGLHEINAAARTRVAVVESFILN